MMDTRLVRLAEVCSQDRQSVRSGERAELRYLGMESIESNTGQLVSGELSKTPESPTANSFLFGTSHVLYGKLRPYLNKVFVPDFEGKSSTELVPLRPCDRLERRYLACFLRAPRTIAAISQRVAGARMPRADMDFVMSLQIPLPPLEEQRRIVDLLSRAENIVRMRREAEAKAREIIPALFLDMFGDPARATTPRTALADLLVADRDGIKCGPFGSALKKHEYVDAGVPVWTMANIADDGFRAAGSLFVTAEKARRLQPYAVRRGDIIISRAGTVGKLAVVDEGPDEAILHTNLVRVSLDQRKIMNDYFAILLGYFGDRVARLKRSSDEAYTFLSAAALPSLVVPVPTMNLQMAFCEQARRAREISKDLGVATRSSVQVLGALLARIFGESAR